MRERTEDLLLRLGFAPHLEGFDYIVDAVELVLNDPDVMRKITTRLYPVVGKRHNVNYKSAERAMRTCIDKAVTLRGDLISEILLLPPRLESGSYSNSEMIALLVKAVKREERNESK